MSFVFLIACLIAAFHGHGGWAVAFFIASILAFGENP